MPAPRRKSGEVSRVRNLRATDAEWQRYGDAAERDGLTRSAWIRRELDRAAKRSERKAARAAADEPTTSRRTDGADDAAQEDKSE